MCIKLTVNYDKMQTAITVIAGIKKMSSNLYFLLSLIKVTYRRSYNFFMEHKGMT